MTQNKPSVYVGMPCYGAIQRQTVVSLLRLFDQFRATGVKAQFHTIQSPLVTHARNLVTCGFLQSKLDYLLFIDADVEFDPEAVYRMLIAKKDVVCTPYRLKTVEDPSKSKYAVKFKSKKQVTVLPGDLVEIEQGPAGIMLIHRPVFETLMEKHPELKIEFPESNRQPMNEEVMGGPTKEDPVKNFMHNFWDTTFSLETGEWKGEDLSFCDLVQRNGFKIYANVASTTGHYGTYGWKGKFNDHLE
jgi:glycosyltransferase involved in cell wall biosynthesis